MTYNEARKFLKFHTAGHVMKTFLSSVILQKHVCEDERNGLLFNATMTYAQLLGRAF